MASLGTPVRLKTRGRLLPEQLESPTVAATRRRRYPPTGLADERRHQGTQKLETGDEETARPAIATYSLKPGLPTNHAV
eukprot:CAMPEP_0182800956 /NCGR_PEP_ID=MMETSP0006_2-20121128/2687_1 /TAXON_ID=97485 /ORGANISM="Prymnesium parvum, Strain Texoma1" /LENGTH=78 /DNA_ID=CAMNT_0024926229 /DNA_START=200 /DNA_END=432 /DNA_ORIENTATION=+